MSRAAALWIAGYPIQATEPTALRRRLVGALERRQRLTLLFANANFAVQCVGLRPQLCDRPTILVNDGVGMDLGAWLVHGRRFPCNLNGTDFVPGVLRAARRPTFLLGGRPGVAARAAKAIAGAGIPVAGHCDGYTGMADNTLLVERIERSGAEVVLVGLGNPMQEEWILANRGELSAPLVTGVGALLDFLAGEMPRAPLYMRRLRLEWLYRLALEPRRLARRYTIDIVRFLALCTEHRRQEAHR